MRVVLATHRYFPVPGGTERVVQTLAEGLAARGDDVTVVTQAEPGAAAREVIGGVRLIRLPVRHLGGVRLPRAYIRTLRRLEADVFHCHGNRIWNADFYFPWARFFRWPQVLTGHGFYQYAVRPRPRDRWYFERYFPRAVRRFDAYAAVTERERTQLRAWGVPEKCMRLVPNGIDLDEFRLGPSTASSAVRGAQGFRAPRLAVYAGGFFENKRVDRLVDALAIARGRWALLAIGRDVSGSAYSARVCAERARRAGVEFAAPGPLARAEVVAAIRAADAVVLGSEYEGFGLLPLEAMAAGRPFVAWNAGAAPELARTGAGFSVDSTEAFAGALGRLEDDTFARAMGAAGQSAAEAYSSHRMIERYRVVYREVQHAS